MFINWTINFHYTVLHCNPGFTFFFLTKWETGANFFCGLPILCDKCCPYGMWILCVSTFLQWWAAFRWCDVTGVLYVSTGPQPLKLHWAAFKMFTGYVTREEHSSVCTSLCLSLSPPTLISKEVKEKTLSDCSVAVSQPEAASCLWESFNLQLSAFIVFVFCMHATACVYFLLGWIAESPF